MTRNRLRTTLAASLALAALCLTPAHAAGTATRTEKDLLGEKQIPASEYMQAREAAVAVIEGRQPDPTGQATHYYATTMPKAPAWAPLAKRTVKIGRHIFLKDVP